MSGSQLAQAEPATPQLERVRGTHAPARQQPSGHEVPSQTQAPATQWSPAPHWGPAPHRHAPAALQASAATALQAEQAPPLGPQVLSDRGWQVEPVQQPVAHEATQPLQPPLVQVSAPGQLWHAKPAAPHTDGVVPEKQAPPAQQPEHDTESQTHAPPLQRWPGAHAAPPPHWQLPAPEQLSARSGSQLAHAAPGAAQAPSARG